MTSVVTAVTHRDEAEFVRVLEAAADVTLLRRCADLAELLSVGAAGVARVAVVSPDLRGLDRDAIRARIVRSDPDARYLHTFEIDLADVTAQYDEFVARFGKYSVLSVAELSDELAFKLRLLLVSIYRRIVLDDPPLPAALLPTDWVGARARRLVAELYDACAASAERLPEAQ